jgi:hypothetical protein
LILDNTPPKTSLTADGVELSTSAAVPLSTGTVLALSATDYYAGDQLPGAGVRDMRLRVDGGAESVYASTFTLVPGTHTLRFFALDALGNTESERTLSVIIGTYTAPAPADVTPPVTTLTLSTGAFISTSTVFSLSAVDPVVDGMASGVRETQLSRDGDAFAVYAGSFVFTSTGTHTLSWFSVDHASNTEVARSTSVFVNLVVSTSTGVDTVPPVTTLFFTTAPYVSSGTFYIDHGNRIGFTAEDFGTPVSGVARTQYSLNGERFQLYTHPFPRSQGAYTLRYRSLDNAGNQEADQAAAVHVDNMPPDSTLVIGSPQVLLPGDMIAISTYTPLTLTAVDPFVRGAASGVKDSWASVHGKTPVQVTGEFFLNETKNGIYRIRYFSRDQVLNRESAKTMRVHLFATQPLPPPSTGSLGPTAIPVSSPNVLNRNALGVPALDEFVLRTAYVFPNPARGGTQPTFHIELGLAERVLIKIYDASGRQVHEVTLTHAALIDAGQGMQYAYEYTWSGTLASGVYFYTVEATKNGHEDIRAQGKFGVIR